MNNAKMYDMFFAPRDRRKPKDQHSDDDWRTTMQPCADWIIENKLSASGSDDEKDRGGDNIKPIVEICMIKF